MYFRASHSLHHEWERMKLIFTEVNTCQHGILLFIFLHESHSQEWPLVKTACILRLFSIFRNWILRQCEFYQVTALKINSQLKNQLKINWRLKNQLNQLWLGAMLTEVSWYACRGPQWVSCHWLAGDYLKIFSKWVMFSLYATPISSILSCSSKTYWTALIVYCH